jgi:hypothetical protein
MAEVPRQLTQAEIDRILFNQRLGIQPTPSSIQNLQQRTSGTVTPIPQNLFQRMAGGASAAGQFVNQAGTAADIAKLFPGYTGQSQVNIPTGFNFAPKQAPTGEVIPGGLQTNQINVNQLLSAIKPADVLGLTGAQQAYTDVGMGKAPKPMDVLDIAGLGAVGFGAGKAAAKGTVSAAKYAAPKVGETLDNYATRTGLILPLDAYHGSPYTFDKFDISKVGTGEGAQAYGHGIYFAEAPGVARGYQMALGQKAGEITTINGKPIEQLYEQIQNKANRLPIDKAAVEYQKAEMLEKMMLDTPPNELISYAKDIGADPAVIKWLETDIAPKTKFPGSFYKVDIPDEAIETFLDWDKPFDEQNNNIKSALNSLHPEVKNKILAKDVGGNPPTGSLIYNRLQQYFSGGRRSDAFSNTANYGAKEASEELNSINIKGIKYFDEQSRIGDKKTRNFVVFDPSIVKMLERNNKPVEGLLGR